MLLCLGGAAWAGGKPSIAILGLEVYDNGTGIDPDTTKAAKELTAALRDRAKAGTGPYTPVQGGEKELIDEKLLNNCDSEANSCMAGIGDELHAEVLLYGKIEKVTQNGSPAYRISLKLLHVGHKQLISSTVETIPTSATSGQAGLGNARNWYGKLAGSATGGTLVIKANIDRGTVLIDEDARGNLASGTVTVTGIAEGRHTLAIEAKDYQRYETQITVRTGETTTQPVTMVELTKPGTGTPGPVIDRTGTVTATRSNVWKPVFYTSAAVTVAGAGFSLFAVWKQRDLAKGVDANADNGSCGNKLTSGNQSEFDSACAWYKAQIVGWIVTGVAGAAAIGSFYMAYLRDGGEESEPRTAGRSTRRKRSPVAITPIVSPQGGGATLRFDW